ncbi:MAG TPA: hypothetical protein VGS22_12560 [Thermoanaerobaculia bacterium]|jgi:hypothetical protein|nr:hypothetical protein [Thermoanaerobaculia bacterium]
MRKSIKKLNLSRETVRSLEEGLDGAAGMSNAMGCMTSGCATIMLTCRSAQNCATVVFPCVTQTGCLDSAANC